jgi:hypothetical protein
MYVDRSFRDPTGKVIVVTMFQCRTLGQLAGVWLRGRGMAKAIKKGAPGLLSSSVSVSPRQRLLVNVSVWHDLKSMLDMGNTERHVRAARHVGLHPGIATTSGVFAYRGDWRALVWDLLRDRFDDGGEQARRKNQNRRDALTEN